MVLKVSYNVLISIIALSYKYSQKASELSKIKTILYTNNLYLEYKKSLFNKLNF